MTLIELLTTLGIVAILSAVAVPSLKHWVHESDRAAAVNGFMHGLFLMRSEAIKRGHAVTLCKSRDGVNCAADAAWHAGWIVFANTNRADVAERDPGEDVIHINTGWTGGIITSNRSSYTFRPYRQSVVNGTIVFCDPRGSAHARAIIISQTGRPRVSQRDSSNRPLRCPSP